MTEAYAEKLPGYEWSERSVSEVMSNINSSGFAARVRTRLQIRSKDQYEYGTKRGHIHDPLLYRLAVKHRGTPRIFRKQIESDTLDTAVSWLGDGSGSMMGEKWAHLVAASVLFNDAIGKVLQVPIEITTFSDGYNHSTGTVEPLMYVHRSFNTRKLGKDELLRRMSVAGSHMDSNADGDSIMWAADRLARQRAKRKLLIVASDGQPATRRPGDIDWYTSKVVKEVEASPIQIVGIGILDDSVTRYYKEHYVINDAGQLETALLHLIEKKMG